MAPAVALRSLMQDRAVLGTFLKLPRPEVVEVLALAGLDFLICDTEHAQIGEAEARTVLQAGHAAGIPIVVRVPTLETGQVNRLLEAGAAGIQLSGTTSADESRRLAAALRYPPQGSRGLSTAQRAAGYGTVPLAEYLERSNRDLLCIGQLESARYDDPLDEVMADLDLAFIGPMDLSVELGCPGEVDAPAVQREIAAIEAAATRTGTPLGIFAGTTPEVERALAAGYRYIAVASDLALLTRAARQQWAGLAGLLEAVRG